MRCDPGPVDRCCVARQIVRGNLPVGLNRDVRHIDLHQTGRVKDLCRDAAHDASGVEQVSAFPDMGGA